MNKLFILLFVVTLSSCINIMVRVDNVITRWQEKDIKQNKNCHPQPFSTITNQYTFYQTFRDIKVENMDTTNFKTIIHNTNQRFKYFAFYTTGCHGTPYEIRYIKKMDSMYKNKVDYYLVSSDNLANYLIQIIQKTMFNFHYPYQTYIIDHQIRSFNDDRKRAFIFRNELCDECKTDIIGVPYILLYDEKGHILFHGYRGYKTEIPNDVISYFIQKK